MRILGNRSGWVMFAALNFILLVSAVSGQKYPIALEKDTILSPRNKDSYQAMAAQYASAACILGTKAQVKNVKKGETITESPACVYNVTEATRLRNELVFTAIAQSDAVFLEYRAGRRKWIDYFDIFMNFLEAGLTAATGITNGERAKSILADVSGLVKGTHSSVAKSLKLAENGILFNVMEKRRAEVLKKIMDALTENDEKYPLMMALMDVMRYYKAGTLDEAISELAATTGQDKKVAVDALEQKRDHLINTQKNYSAGRRSTRATENLKRLSEPQTSFQSRAALIEKLKEAVSEMENDTSLVAEIKKYRSLNELFQDLQNCENNTANPCADDDFLELLIRFRAHAQLIDFPDMLVIDRIIGEIP